MMSGSFWKLRSENKKYTERNIAETLKAILKEKMKIKDWQIIRIPAEIFPGNKTQRICLKSLLISYINNAL